MGERALGGVELILTVAVACVVCVCVWGGRMSSIRIQARAFWRVLRPVGIP